MTAEQRDAGRWIEPIRGIGMTSDQVPESHERQPTKLAEDALRRWAWVEPSVWTSSMLTTLETNNVRGGKWHSLMDKVYKPRNLTAAYHEVAANKGAAGVDHVSIEDFTAQLWKNLAKLEEQLRDGIYKP